MRKSQCEWYCTAYPAHHNILWPHKPWGCWGIFTMHGKASLPQHPWGSMGAQQGPAKYQREEGSSSPLAKHKGYPPAFKRGGFCAGMAFRWRFNILLEHLFFSREKGAGWLLLCDQQGIRKISITVPSGYEFVAGKYNHFIHWSPLANARREEPIRWVTHRWDCAYSCCLTHSSPIRDACWVLGLGCEVFRKPISFYFPLQS